MNNEELAMKDVWTPHMRDAWIEDAVHATKQRGYRGKNYKFFAMPKALGGVQNESPIKDKLSQAMARTINHKSEENRHPFKQIPMRIFPRLVENLRRDNYLRALIDTGDLVVFIKGSAAYPYIAPNDPELRAGGDIDIGVYINPHINKTTFNITKMSTMRIVMQTLSQYKRCLDQMLFAEDGIGNTTKTAKIIRDVFLDENQLGAFKTEIEKALEETGFEFKSPFVNTNVRNSVSRQSFIIADSLVNEEDVLHVDIPHFEMCENIPLKRTPLVCSHNRTIRFERCAADSVAFGSISPVRALGSFDLFRLKLNVMLTNTDNNTATCSAEFIDITVPRQDDAELLEFFKKDGTSSPPTQICWDYELECEVRVPTVETAIADLFRILYIYACPESKMGKRYARYKRLLEIRASISDTHQ